MAWIALDDLEQHVTVDLHKYTVRTACVVADTKIKEAWENGCTYITFIHGAPGSTHHWQDHGYGGGYGGIKWSLRGVLFRGKWMQWAYNRRSRQHSIADGALTPRLRPNPAPTAPQQWTDIPDDEY